MSKVGYYFDDDDLLREVDEVDTEVEIFEDFTTVTIPNVAFGEALVVTFFHDDWTIAPKTD